MRGDVRFFVSVIFAIFALPALADQPAGARESATVSATQERSIRGVVEVIDTRAERIQLSGRDYVFSPAKVRVTNKTGMVPSSASFSSSSCSYPPRAGSPGNPSLGDDSRLARR